MLHNNNYIIKSMDEIKSSFTEKLLHFKGVVRSKIFRGFVKLDGLGETLLFTQTELDKN